MTMFFPEPGPKPSDQSDLPASAWYVALLLQCQPSGTFNETPWSL